MHPLVTQLYKSQLEKYRKEFRGFENPKNFVLLKEEWGIDNGMLTPTLKLRRSVVEERYKSQIEGLYS